MDQCTRDRLLVGVLRLGAVLTLSAFFAVFLPADVMVSIHAWLGLGSLPMTPVVDYLARSLALFYAVHGGLLLVLSLDVARYRPVVAYVGWSTLVMGIVLTGIDLHAGLPIWWVLGEGPPVILVGVLLIGLSRAPAATPPETT